jgi:hypothetical protein
MIYRKSFSPKKYKRSSSPPFFRSKEYYDNQATSNFKMNMYQVMNAFSMAQKGVAIYPEFPFGLRDSPLSLISAQRRVNLRSHGIEPLRYTRRQPETICIYCGKMPVSSDIGKHSHISLCRGGSVATLNLCLSQNWVKTEDSILLLKKLFAVYKCLKANGSVCSLPQGIISSDASPFICYILICYILESLFQLHTLEECNHIIAFTMSVLKDRPISDFFLFGHLPVPMSDLECETDRRFLDTNSMATHPLYLTPSVPHIVQICRDHEGLARLPCIGCRKLLSRGNYYRHLKICGGITDTYDVCHFILRQVLACPPGNNSDIICIVQYSRAEKTVLVLWANGLMGRISGKPSGLSTES